MENQLAEQIREWAQVTDWTQPYVITHRLYLARQFGRKVRQAAVELETQGRCGLARRAESVFETLRETAGQLDNLCRLGLSDEDDFAEFEFVRARLVETADELATVLSRGQTGLKGVKLVTVPVVEYEDCMDKDVKPQTPQRAAETRPERDGLLNKEYIAYQSYQYAEEKIGEKVTDREAYDFLKEQGVSEYQLPAFETWRRYVRKGRKAFGTQKNTARYGRASRSTVSVDRL